MSASLEGEQSARIRRRARELMSKKVRGEEGTRCADKERIVTRGTGSGGRRSGCGEQRREGREEEGGAGLG